MKALDPDNFKSNSLEDVFIINNNMASATRNDILRKFITLKLSHKWVNLRNGYAKTLLENNSTDLLRSKVLLVFGNNIPEIDNSNSFNFYDSKVNKTPEYKSVSDEIKYIDSQIDALSKIIHFSELPSIIGQVIAQINSENNLEKNPIIGDIEGENQVKKLFEELTLRMILDEQFYLVLETICKNRKAEFSSIITKKFSKALNFNDSLEDPLNQKLNEYLAIRDLENLSEALSAKTNRR